MHPTQEIWVFAHSLIIHRLSDFTKPVPSNWLIFKFKKLWWIQISKQILPRLFFLFPNALFTAFLKKRYQRYGIQNMYFVRGIRSCFTRKETPLAFRTFMRNRRVERREGNWTHSEEQTLISWDYNLPSVFIPPGHTSNNYTSHLYFVVIGILIKYDTFSCEADRKCKKVDTRFLHIDARMHNYTWSCIDVNQKFFFFWTKFAHGS